MNNNLYDSSNFYKYFNSKNNKKPEKKKTSYQLIAEALEIGHKLDSDLRNPSNPLSKTNKQTLEIIFNTNDVAKEIFLSNLNEKKFKEVTEKFTKNVDKINENLLYLIDKNLDKISKCKNDIEISKNKNESLQKTLKELNDNCTKIENEIRQRNDEINSLQVKFSIYEKIKPIFEEIINVFPGRDPKELINKIKFSKDENVAKIEQINRITDKINEIENDTKKNTLKQNKTKQELVHKITELQLDIESKNESYKREISDLENEIKIYKNYQKENFKTNNLLYQLFLDIISKIQKDKYIEFVKIYGKDPSKRENFDAGIYNEKKFNDLLSNTLLKYVTHSKGSWQLRQIIAYANMLIRNYLEKKKENIRFDPSATFREFKNLIDKKEFENYKLGCIIQNLKITQSKNKHIIKELLNNIKMCKLKFNNLRNKADRQLRVDKRSNKLSNLNVLTFNIPKRISVSALQRNKKRFLDGMRKFRSKSSKKVTKKLHYDPNKKKFFITSDGKKYNKNDIKNKNLEINLSSDDDDDFNINSSDEEDNEKDSSLISGKESSYQEKLKFYENEIKKFKNLEMSKNKDKLIKSNGFQGMDNFISGIKTIVENTSRVIYFQNQFISKQKKEERINSTYNTTASNFNKNLTTERNKKLYNKYKEDPKFQYHEMKYNALSKKILNKLDSMMEQVKN